MSTKSDLPRGRDPEVQYWLDEIEACRKREKDFTKKGQHIWEMYEGLTRDQTPFNILFSNTETMLPALYSAVPRPLVERRFKDDDPLGHHAAQAGQRVLEFLMDTNLEGYESFDEALKAATLDALLPGRGVTCIKYDAEIVEEPGEQSEEPEPAYKENELVCCETKTWNRVYIGYAKKWSKCPWMAFEDYIDKAEASRLFGKAVASKLKYTEGDSSSREENRTERGEEKYQGKKRTTCIYQIWDKDSKTVIYIQPEHPQVLRTDEDPLQLTGFFPCPRPLTFVDKTTSLTPSALYTLYENQASELNRLTNRIKYITEAMKARGVYDAELGDELAKIMTVDDNALVPADKSSSLAAEKGLSNAIWMMPLDVLQQVLQNLLAAREQVKQTIYEITGISDILRGATKASETLGAQQIKTQWGGLRLKNKQKEVARYARDLLRMMLELAAQNFSEETWAKMTGLPFLLMPKFLELTQVQKLLQQQVAMAQQLQQPIAPQQMQQLEQVTQALQTPKWEDVLSVLRDDLTRAYRVDIETNSTVEPEAAEDHQAIQDLMLALGQVMQGMGPMVQSGVLPFQAAQSLLLFIARRYRFGNEIEQYIQSMQPPKPEQQDDSAAKMQQLKMQQQVASQQLDMQKQMAQHELEKKSLQAEHEDTKRKMALELQGLQVKMEAEKAQMQQRMGEEKLSLRDQVSQSKLSHEKQVATLQNSKFKTENVVNQKADQTITKGIQGLEKIVSQLVTAVAAQSQENQAMLQTVVQAITAPRVKKAIRGVDGRIEAVHEQVA